MILENYSGENDGYKTGQGSMIRVTNMIWETINIWVKWRIILEVKREGWECEEKIIERHQLQKKTHFVFLVNW